MAHYLWCNVISWAKIFYMFSIDYHHLKWVYSIIKQHDMEIKVWYQRTVWGFFWKLLLLLEKYRHSYLMYSVQLIDCWRVNDNFFLNKFYFTPVKEFWYGKRMFRDFLKKFFKYYFLNIIVNLLWFEYYCEYNPEILTQAILK